MKYYEAVVKYDRIGEKATTERVTEQYLIYAVSITDAEATLIKDLEPFIKGFCEVTSIKLAKYTEYIPFNILLSTKILSVNVFEVNADTTAPDNCKYFGVKVSFISIDENTGKKKKTPTHYLVIAENLNDAERYTQYYIRDSMADYEINNIVETRIVDVIAPPAA